MTRATDILVETLLLDGDIAEATRAVDRMANTRADEPLEVREVTVLKLRAGVACGASARRR